MILNPLGTKKFTKYVQSTGHELTYQLGIVQSSILLSWPFCATQIMNDSLDMRKLSGFNESFRSTYFGRFYLAAPTEMQH